VTKLQVHGWEVLAMDTRSDPSNPMVLTISKVATTVGPRSPTTLGVARCEFQPIYSIECQTLFLIVFQFIQIFLPKLRFSISMPSAI
jgi:hypothetical protein